MSRLTEKTVEKKVAAYYTSQDSIVLRQAIFSRKRIDIVKREKNDHRMVAIEIKLRDWQGGLRQATVNAVACDFSYVAIWHQYAGPVLSNKKLFEDRGIGLIIIDAQFVPRVEVESGYKQPSSVIRKYFSSSNLQLA